MKTNLKKPFKLLLSTVPLVDPTTPPSSIASLQAYLKKNNFKNIVVADWNIEFVDWILNSKRILKYYKKMLLWMKSQIKNGVKKNNREKFQYWYPILNEKRYIKEIQFIDKAKKIIRSKDFYDLNKYKRANECITLMFKLLEMSCFPFIQSPLIFYNVYEQTNTKKRLIKTINQFEKLKINPFLDFINEVVTKKAESSRISCVGLSISCSTQIFMATVIAKTLKQKIKCKILFGGPAISQMTENIIDGFIKIKKGSVIPFVDDIIYGDSEEPLLQYVTGKDKKSIPNLVQSNGVFNIKKNNIWIVSDLNILPTPDYTGYPLKLYLTPKPTLSIVPTRGCYWSKCVFCRESYRGLNSKMASAKYRQRNIDKIICDIQTLKNKYDTDCFMLGICAITSKNLIKLSKQIIKNKIKISYALDLRLENDYVDRKNANILFKGGLKVAAVGFESFSNKVLCKMKKGINTKLIEKGIKQLANAGIVIKPLWFMGFPNETKEDLLKTINFLTKHKKYIHDAKDIYPLVIPVGSRIHEHASEYGLEILNTYGEYDPLANFIYTNIDGKTVDDIQRIAKQKMASCFPSFKGYLLFSNFMAHTLIMSTHKNMLNNFEKIVANQNNEGKILFKQLLDKKTILMLNPNIFISNLNTESDGTKIDGKIVFSDKGFHSHMNDAGVKLLNYFKTGRSIDEILLFINKHNINISIIKRLFDGKFIQVDKVK